MMLLPNASFTGPVADVELRGVTIDGPIGDQRLREVLFYASETSADDALNAARLAAPQVGDIHPTRSDFSFTDEDGSSVKCISKGKGCELHIVWKQTAPDPAQPAPPLPATKKTFTAARVLRKISRHPKFTTNNPAWSGGRRMLDFYDHTTGGIFDTATVPQTLIKESGDRATALAAGNPVPDDIRGMTVFPDCAGTVTVSTYSHTEPVEPWTQCGIADPPGVPASGGKYRVESGSNTQEGAFWRQDLHYVYSAKAWPAFLDS